jgi:maltose operon protein
MIIITRSIVVACAALSLIVAGCAASSKDSWLDPLESSSPIYTDVSPSAAESRAALNAAPICCDSLAELRFEPLDIERTKYYPINNSAQAFRFSTGKSFVRAFRLPDQLERATVTLSAIAGATVFVPTILILDEEFRVSRSIDSSNFAYTPAGFMEPQRLRGRFHFDRRRGGELAAERYFVVFTTDADLRGSTQMISEARLYARSRGLADPGLPDPVADHAATGVFRVSVGDLETITRGNTDYVDERREAERYVAPAVAAPAAPAEPAPRTAPRAARQTPPPPAPVPATAPAGEMPMLSETQAMYDKMIRDAVRNGQMDRAWRLVQEAERAGSSSARDTFLKAVERK